MNQPGFSIWTLQDYALLSVFTQLKNSTMHNILDIAQNNVYHLRICCIVDPDCDI